MTVRKLILRWANVILLKALPGYVYVQVARWSIPLFDWRRRDLFSRVRACESGYVFQSKAGTIYFYSPYNVGRYLFTSESQSIKQRMLGKYLGDRLTVPVGGVVVDVGANVGEFSMAIAEQGGRVYACEPDPGPFPSLRKNLATMDNASCHKVAFGEQPGQLPFYISSEHNDSSFIEPETGVERVENIAVSTIDQFCAEEGLTDVSLLKVEAEGYEPEILRGGIKMLSKSVRQVVVDGGPERYGQPTIDECDEILKDAGFVTFRDGEMLYGVSKHQFCA